VFVRVFQVRGIFESSSRFGVAMFACVRNQVSYSACIHARVSSGAGLRTPSLATAISTFHAPDGAIMQHGVWKTLLQLYYDGGDVRCALHWWPPFSPPTTIFRKKTNLLRRVFFSTLPHRRRTYFSSLSCTNRALRWSVPECVCSSRHRVVVVRRLSIRWNVKVVRRTDPSIKVNIINNQSQISE
jgi:hypothetical protein